MKVKYFFVLITLILALVFSGCVSQEQAGNETVQNEAVKTIQRPLYGLPQGVFLNLPEFPQDFNKIVFLYQSNEFSDELFFSEKYYLQPEFYPSFAPSGLSKWLYPDAGYWAAYGYGSYPLKKTIQLKRGEKKSVAFFMHSGYGVQSWQGVSITAQQTLGAESVATEIAEPDFLLGPNFPKFSSSWAKKVVVKVSADENASGEHSFMFTVARPPSALKEEWSNVRSPYFDAATVQSGKPLYELIVQII
ncbi:MAG: hypothetical protein NUV67_01530 [archaeon]|nr:hypothetical protein [archaeon]